MKRLMKLMERQGPKQAGFTLLELMVVVAIVGILATIALPSYQDYVNKSRTRTAMADLVALATVVENEFQRNLKYPKKEELDLDKLPTWKPAQQDFFTYAYDPSPDKIYTLSATGKGPMDGCKLTLRHDNSREVSSVAACGSVSW